MTVRIGGGQGFYGDGLDPVGDVLADGVDYLVCEALAELTLAILQKDRQRDESQGFTKDLPAYLNAALPAIVDGRTKFITNAGGINPVAAGRAAAATLKAAGATGVKVATVVGDDVRGRGDELRLPADALFANAYLGARPIVEALDAGATVVVTGRVADASLFAAPLIHEFGWGWDDWDRLAAGVTVGHLLECSGQVTGGNYSGPWWENPDPLRIAFPLAECEPDGSAVITKPFNDQDLLDAVQGALDIDSERRQQKRDLTQLVARYDTLTAREREVMALVVTGLMNKEIAAVLGTSEKTIKVHRARVMQKMKVDSLVALVRVADRLHGR